MQIPSLGKFCFVHFVRLRLFKLKRTFVNTFIILGFLIARFLNDVAVTELLLFTFQC